MQINPSDRLLALLLKTVQETLLPELQSGAAKGAAQMMCAVLMDLSRREHGTGSMLRGVIEQGEALARELSAQLGIANVVPTPQADDAALSVLLQKHGELTVRLADLCEELAETADDGRAVSGLLRRAAEWELSYYTQQAALPLPALPRDPPAGEPLSATKLQDFLNHEAASGSATITVTHFEPLVGGFGKQTFLADTRQGDVANALVVRKSDPRPIMQFGACLLRSEYALLRALMPLNYPAPRPQLYCVDHGGVDAPYYTMDRIAGSPPGTYLGGLNAPVDERIFLKLAELLARLHSVPVTHFAEYIAQHDDPRILDGNIEDCYRYNLEGWRNYIHRERHLQSPYLIWLLDWLQTHIPRDSRKPVLVHGDFNIHNILVDDNQVTAILDWECAGFGAPEQDLAYIQPHISRHIEWERFVSHYLAHGGQPIRTKGMDFGFVYSALRTVLAGNRGSSNLQSGANEDLRYAMVELGFMGSFMGMALRESGGKA
ncbi:MAG: phosphotransferase family protein [Panacagrimonas sp.]